MSHNSGSDVADVVMATIETHAPTNVEREAVTITGEGTSVSIVLVPHRDLAGTALVVLADEQRIDLRWAHIGDLSTHDDIDLGIRTQMFDWAGDWQSRLRSALSAELVRPIRLQSRRTMLGKPLIECWLDLGEKAKRIGVLHPKGTHFKGSRGQPTQWETTLAGGDPLPITEPPPLANWRRNA